MSNYFSRFSEWQLYVHYVLLALWVYFWHWLPYNEVVEKMYINNPMIGILALIIWWSIGLFIGDSIIHGLFWFSPEPLRWRD